MTTTWVDIDPKFTPNETLVWVDRFRAWYAGRCKAGSFSELDMIDAFCDDIRMFAAAGNLRQFIFTCGKVEGYLRARGIEIPAFETSNWELRT